MTEILSIEMSRQKAPKTDEDFRFMQAVNYVVRKYGETYKSLSQMLGPNEFVISKINTGSQSAGGELIKRFCDKYDEINYMWILTNDGSMISEGGHNEEHLVKRYLKENKELEEKVKQLEARVQMLTDKLIKLTEEYTELLKKQSK